MKHLDLVANCEDQDRQSHFQTNPKSARTSKIRSDFPELLLHQLVKSCVKRRYVPEIFLSGLETWTAKSENPGGSNWSTRGLWSRMLACRFPNGETIGKYRWTTESPLSEIQEISSYPANPFQPEKHDIQWLSMVNILYFLMLSSEDLFLDKSLRSLTKVSAPELVIWLRVKSRPHGFSSWVETT